MMVKQSIIVSKGAADTREAAKKIAGKYADRLYTSRETGSSFRFRQRPPSDFVPGSFRTMKKGKVSIVMGKLKGD